MESCAKEAYWDQLECRLESLSISKTGAYDDGFVTNTLLADFDSCTVEAYWDRLESHFESLRVSKFNNYEDNSLLIDKERKVELTEDASDDKSIIKEKGRATDH